MSGVCVHGQDDDWHGIAGDFLPCECCGGPVSALGAFTPPPAGVVRQSEHAR